MITAICNQKGGVGKTAVTTALAYELARDGSVLVVDCDPQGAATSILGVEVPEGGLTLHDVMAAGQAGSAGHAMYQAGPGWGHISVVPAETELANQNTLQVAEPGWESRLKTALDGISLLFDHVLIDCPPSLDVLTTNALNAADQVLIVTEARAKSVDGISLMIEAISKIRTFYNPGLDIAGIVINRYRVNRLDPGAWREALRELYPDLLLEAVIPEREVVSGAATNHVPVPADTADYHDAIKAIANRVKGN